MTIPLNLLIFANDLVYVIFFQHLSLFVIVLFFRWLSLQLFNAFLAWLLQTWLIWELEITLSQDNTLHLLVKVLLRFTFFNLISENIPLQYNCFWPQYQFFLGEYKLLALLKLVKHLLKLILISFLWVNYIHEPFSELFLLLLGVVRYVSLNFITFRFFHLGCSILLDLNLMSQFKATERLDDEDLE